MIPDGWTYATIESVCAKVTSGGTPSRKRPEFYGGEIPWVKTRELQDGWVRRTEEHLTQVGLDSSSAKLLPANTILMAMYGATVGKLGLLADEMTCNQAACALIVDPKVASFRFLFYRLLLERSAITTLATGAAQQNLNAGTIRSAQLLFPPLEEQERIAGVLGAFDDLIETNRETVRCLDRLGRLVVYSFATANRAAPTVTLAEACDVIESGRRPKGGVKGITSGVPSLGAEFINGLTEFEFAKTKFVPVEFVDGMRRGVVADLDVLVYKDGGKPGEFFPDVSVVGNGYPFDHMVINEHVFRVRGSETLGQGFLYFWLSTDMMMGLMKESGSRTAAIPGMNSTSFGQLPIVLPDAEWRSEYMEALDQLLVGALSLLAENRDLARKRDELLPLLMSGQVRVRDVEVAVS